MPSDLDPILIEVTGLVDQLKILSQKRQANLQPDFDSSLGKLAALMRNFVETKKRMVLGIPDVDQPTTATIQRIECALEGIPDECKPLILAKVLSSAANATKSLSEVKRVDILGRIAAVLALLGLEKQSSELFTKIIKIADRSSGHTKADMYARIAWALSSAGRKGEAVEALAKAISQAKNSRDYSEKTAEITALMGRTDDAIELTKKEKPEYERVRTLAQIARSLALKGMIEEATRTLDRALEICEGISGKLSKARAQTGLAGALVLVGRVSEATDMAGRIMVKGQRLGALMNVTESLTMQNKTVEAMKIVNEEFKGAERKSALSRVAGAVALSKGPDEALSLSREIDRFHLDLWVRPKLVRSLAFSGRIVEAVEIMNSIPERESEERANALADIAEAFTLPKAPLYQGLLLF